jgi:hypothetical protein
MYTHTTFHSCSVITVTTNIYIFDTIGYRFQLYRETKAEGRNYPNTQITSCDKAHDLYTIYLGASPLCMLCRQQ